MKRTNWRYGRLEGESEEDMGKHRAFPKRRQTERFADHQEEVHIIHVLYGPTWAGAWPSLDEWFKPEALLSAQDGKRDGR